MNVISPEYVHVLGAFRDFSVAGAALYLVWRIAFAAATFSRTQVDRTKIESDMLDMVRDFIETQRETNKQLSVALELHAGRLNRLEEKAR